MVEEGGIIPDLDRRASGWLGLTGKGHCRADAEVSNFKEHEDHLHSAGTDPCRQLVNARVAARSMVSCFLPEHSSNTLVDTSMKRLLALMFSVALFTQSTGLAADAFALWPNGAPGALGSHANDIPTLTPYPAETGSRTGAAMIICPGGGYGGLASHEGADYALYLNRLGISCFVLKYRLGSHGYRHPAMLNDVQRAVRTVRSRASEWGLDPGKIGVMGSSAGGHLASTAVTHFDAGQVDATDPIDRVSSRPDVGVLCYPVITMGTYTHAGSRQNLLGTNPPPALIWELSNELQVTPRTPPCFLWHTQEDTAVPVENSLQFVAALQKAKVPYDLHVYGKGRHGIGLASKPPEVAGVHPWALDLSYWLKQRGFAR